MKTAVNHSSGRNAHEKALLARHAALQSRIEQEEKRPAANYLAVRKMKLEKLHLKELIERIREE